MRVVELVICFLTFGVFQLSAQVRCEAYMPSFFVDIDGGIGGLNQQAKITPLSTAYPGLVDPAIGKMSFSNGVATTGSVDLGLYVNQKRTLGVGIGLMYSRQTTDLGLNAYHVEYSATDDKGNVFRQLVTANHSISESITRTSLHIPILLRYKKDFSPKLFLSVDGGLVYNIQLQNTWNTNANFDYEAIYKFSGSGSDVTTSYDNAPTPGSSDWLITKAQFLKDNPKGDVNAYFAAKNAAGYNVGLNEGVKNRSGSFKMATGSLGYTIAAALNFKVSRKAYFKLGGYYLSQKFTNTSQNNALPLTGKITRNSAGQDTGVEYNSLMSSVKTVQDASYGITLGIKVFISRHSLLDYE